MNQPLVDKIVNAVLYEGYILYPYRPTSKKNQQRFSFGRVYPCVYSVAQEGAEPCMMQTECLARGRAESAAVGVAVRFLHPIAREVEKFITPVVELPAGAAIPAAERVPELRAGGRLYQRWQEVAERNVEMGLPPLASLVHSPVTKLFSFPAGCEREPIRDDGQFTGMVVRRQEAIEGAIEISAAPVEAEVFKISVRVFNYTPLAESELGNQEAVLMRTFASTHTILNIESGEFISLISPPSEYAAMAASCKNIGAWPVLVGDEKKCERETMLSSPIILYDYPQIAPESPGDLHDGTEIDEILTLRIMAMTDGEKLEMRDVDEYARRILERTEAMPEEHFMKMHGVMRDVRTAGEEFFNPVTKLGTVRVCGVALKAGDKVRIRPKRRADAIDMAMSGKTAIIEAIEEDAEDHVHLALVLEDDPGKDLGMLRQPGHRFFYGTDEVEPLEAARS